MGGTLLSGLIPLHSTGLAAKGSGSILLRNASLDPFALDRTFRMRTAYTCFGLLFFFMICSSCKQFGGYP